MAGTNDTNGTNGMNGTAGTDGEDGTDRGAVVGLSSTAARAIEDLLAEPDARAARLYPGDAGARQPVHTVYVPGDRYNPDLPTRWGRQAQEALDAVGGIDVLLDAHALVTDPGERALIAGLVLAKLEAEPIEDLRIDFEDGYGGDDEDADVRAAARAVAQAGAAGRLPPFVGIRFKCLEPATRARGLRTLALFVGELLASGGLPDGLVLTLPKVTSVAQVRAMVLACADLEARLGLVTGRLRFEIQVETPQAILGADGTALIAPMLHAGQGRVSGLHYGTYDYSASLGIAAADQSMEHPAADHAKAVMQLAAAGTGVHLSDGSTNVLPVGEPDGVRAAWALHGRLVTRSLHRGFYQGWDLHPAQLPSRFAATYAYFRASAPDAVTRLGAYLDRRAGAVLDEPATAKALAGFVLRGLDCGALAAADLAGLERAPLASLARPARA
nr:aldolase/citrate lyase family protein [Occultella kanbiaonis]